MQRVALLLIAIVLLGGCALSNSGISRGTAITTVQAEYGVPDVISDRSGDLERFYTPTNRPKEEWPWDAPRTFYYLDRNLAVTFACGRAVRAGTIESDTRELWLLRRDGAPTTAATGSRESTRTVVLRHHPGMIDTAPSERHWVDRDADVELIKVQLVTAGMGYEYAGGLGRGYELAVSTKQLPEWKRLINRLIRDGELKYYTRWGLDHHGFGLVPLD